MTTRIYFVTFMYFNEGGEAKISEFVEKSRQLFKKYDLRIEQMFKPAKKGEIGGVSNPIEQPDRIQIFSMPDRTTFEAYTADEQYLSLAKIRASGLRKFTLTMANPYPFMKFSTDSPGLDRTHRTYAIAYIQFKQGGEQGFIDFNLKGVSSGLYQRHGMHVQAAYRPVHATALIGPLDFAKPDIIVLFYLDDISKMPQYLADPQYKKIAPLRDQGLQSYYFFLGQLM